MLQNLVNMAFLYKAWSGYTILLGVLIFLRKNVAFFSECTYFNLSTEFMGYIRPLILNCVCFITSKRLSNLSVDLFDLVWA